MESTLIADWSELPNDILEHLTSFFSLGDYHRFGAVCRNWFSVAKQKRHPPRQLPWLVMGEDDATHKRKFFSIEENKHYMIDIPELRGQHLCGSSFGWLFTLDIKLNFRLLNPFTKKFYDLPPLPPYRDPLNDLFEEMLRPYLNDFTLEEMQLRLVSKAILDRDPSRFSDFKVLIIYGKHRKLACWSLGDLDWTLIHGEPVTINDIVFFKEKFYAVGDLYRYNLIYVVNVGPDSEIKQVWPQALDNNSIAHLVDYLGQLLLVQKPRKITNKGVLIKKNIIVIHVDLEEEKYCNYKPVDGCVVFISENSCVTVDPNKYLRCKKNALFLTDKPHYFIEEVGCKDLWIYNMAECPCGKYYCSKPYIPSIWLIPNHQ